MADAELNALASASLPLDTANDLLYVEQGGIGKKIAVGDFKNDIVKALTSTQANSTVTGASITQFETSLAPGTYEIKCSLLWQAAATTTGAAFYLNGSGGTVTKNVGHVYTTTTGTTATTGVADQATVAATFQMLESRAWRANNTNPGAFGGVDTANADQLAILEAVVVVTATTTLQVMFASEVASSAVTMQAGSSLKINKIA